MTFALSSLSVRAGTLRSAQHSSHMTLQCPAHARRQWAPPCQRVRCQAKTGDTLRRSFDSEDDLDKDLADELRAVADPERAQKLARHFELAWKISNRPGKPQRCDCCHGSKEEECHWCHGTGYLMVGNQMFPSTSNHINNCPVCKGKGYISCERCRGTGFRATWLPSDTDLLP